jgi:hypothetical protein
MSVLILLLPSCDNPGLAGAVRRLKPRQRLFPTQLEILPVIHGILPSSRGRSDQ